MATKILIMGLPGAGKTTLAEALRERIWQEGRTVTWLNADEVRKQHDDWDFSETGRVRQSKRMFDLAKAATTDYVIADFVAPLALSYGTYHCSFPAVGPVFLEEYSDIENWFLFHRSEVVANFDSLNCEAPVGLSEVPRHFSQRLIDVQGGLCREWWRVTDLIAPRSLPVLIDGSHLPAVRLCLRKVDGREK